MPVFFNTAAHLILGSLFAIAARHASSLRRTWLSEPFLIVMAFEAFAVTPVVTYLFRFYPHWSLSYLWDPHRDTSLSQRIGVLSAAGVLLNVLCLWVGFTWTRWGILRRKAWITALPLGIGSAGLVTLGLLFGNRLFNMGDFDTFWQGQASVLWKHVAGWLGIALYAAAGALVGWAFRYFGKPEKR